MLFEDADFFCRKAKKLKFTFNEQREYDTIESDIELLEESWRGWMMIW